MLKRYHPEYIRLIYDLIDKTPIAMVFALEHKNHWIKEYIKDKGYIKEPKVKTDDISANNDVIIDGQMTIFEGDMNGQTFARD